MSEDSFDELALMRRSAFDLMARGRLLSAAIATIFVPLPRRVGPTASPPFLALANVASMKASCRSSLPRLCRCLASKRSAFSSLPLRTHRLIHTYLLPPREPARTGATVTAPRHSRNFRRSIRTYQRYMDRIVKWERSEWMVCNSETTKLFGQLETLPFHLLTKCESHRQTSTARFSLTKAVHCFRRRLATSSPTPAATR